MRGREGVRRGDWGGVRRGDGEGEGEGEGEGTEGKRGGGGRRWRTQVMGDSEARREWERV